MNIVVIPLGNRSNICDKCGREVLPNNDVLFLMEELTGFPLLFLSAPSRHLLPLFEGGKQVCEGSPSRAQYLEGQPKDRRGYPYRLSTQILIRKAYARLCRRYAAASVAGTN